MKKTFSISEEEHGERVDKVVARNVQKISRSKCQKLIQKSLIKVNGRIVKPSYPVKAGDLIEIERPERKKKVKPQDIPIDIIYANEDIIVVNKPSGMVVHPAPGNPANTLVNALLYRYRNLAEVGEPERPGIVHRLDKQTSGVLVVARTDRAYRDLIRQFKKREVGKIYVSLVHGSFEEEEGIIDMPIGRDKIHRKKMTVTSKDGKKAVTEFVVKEKFKKTNMLEIRPRTGRTHQIRVHLSRIEHPLLGDKKYGKRHENLNVQRVMLHAKTLKFSHPRTKRKMKFEAPLPDDFKKALKSCKKY